VSVDFAQHGAVAVVTLNRPEALNALSVEMLDDIIAAVDRVEADPQIRVMVITGAGEKAFSAGADISHMREASVDQARAFGAKGHEAARRLESCSRPVIAAINGFALGGGCELIIACDIRLASERAKFGQPEVNIGILPGWGGTQRLVRIAGLGWAKEMVFTGRICTADEARVSGLVTHVYPHDTLMDEALALAELIAAKPPLAIAAAKELMNIALDDAQEVGLARELEAFAQSFATHDQREGMAAFFEKRPATFEGR